MIDQPFTSESEINTMYANHLESLLVSGLPFDEASLRAEWADAILNFREGRSKPAWLTESL